jgi:hypothetical protein
MEQKIKGREKKMVGRNKQQRRQRQGELLHKSRNNQKNQKNQKLKKRRNRKL